MAFLVTNTVVTFGKTHQKGSIYIVFLNTILPGCLLKNKQETHNYVSGPFANIFFQSKYFVDPLP